MGIEQADDTRVRETQRTSVARERLCALEGVRTRKLGPFLHLLKIVPFWDCEVFYLRPFSSIV